MALSLVGLAGVSQAEIAQKGTLRVSFEGKINPTMLPRRGAAPIAVTVGGRITTTDESEPPQLQRIEIAINRAGHLDHTGLPTCKLSQIQPSNTRDALASCGGAKVGEGSFSANVALPEQSPFPSQGKLVAFNGIQGGQPVIFAHIYGTNPIPTSYTLPLLISRSKGTFGTILTASLPQVTSSVAFVTNISITLHRSFRYLGSTHSYLSAGCPAPAGFHRAMFPLAKASFAFAGRLTLTSTLNRSCRAKG